MRPRSTTKTAGAKMAASTWAPGRDIRVPAGHRARQCARGGLDARWTSVAHALVHCAPAHCLDAQADHLATPPDHTAPSQTGPPHAVPLHTNASAHMPNIQCALKGVCVGGRGADLPPPEHGPPSPCVTPSSWCLRAMLLMHRKIMCGGTAWHTTSSLIPHQSVDWIRWHNDCTRSQSRMRLTTNTPFV